MRALKFCRPIRHLDLDLIAYLHIQVGLGESRLKRHHARGHCGQPYDSAPTELVLAPHLVAPLVVLLVPGKLGAAKKGPSGALDPSRHPRSL